MLGVDWGVVGRSGGLLTYRRSRGRAFASWLEASRSQTWCRFSTQPSGMVPED